jgi:MerR family Zn(II)-responsive transcriptional regulator of zntA
MINGLRVGELSAKSGVGRKILRLYEVRHILPAPERTPAGYRVYPPETLALLGFVARAAPRPHAG